MCSQSFRVSAIPTRTITCTVQFSLNTGRFSSRVWYKILPKKTDLTKAIDTSEYVGLLWSAEFNEIWHGDRIPSRITNRLAFNLARWILICLANFIELQNIAKVQK